jgi:general secretion pathway protein A
MYQSHFNFKNPPFRKITRLGRFSRALSSGCFQPAERENPTGGNYWALCDDAPLLGQFSDALKSATPDVLAINAFPKLSASSLLYKLNPGTKESKNRIQAVDAVLHQWQGEKAGRKCW